MLRLGLSFKKQAKCMPLCALCVCMQSARVLRNQSTCWRRHISICAWAPSPGAVYM